MWESDLGRVLESEGVVRGRKLKTDFIDSWLPAFAQRALLGNQPNNSLMLLYPETRVDPPLWWPPSGQETTGTAILLFHRFLIQERVGKHRRNRDVILTTCLFLAGKVTEAPRRLRDVINVLHMLTSANQDEPPLLDKVRQESPARCRLFSVPCWRASHSQSASNPR